MKRLGTVVALLTCLAAGYTAGFKTALAASIAAWSATSRFLGEIHKEVWSNPDLKAALKAADELYTPDFVVHDSIGDSRGLANRKKDIADNRAAYPDYSEEVLDVVAEGDMVVTRFLSTGTQKGDLAAIPGYQPLLPANCKFTRTPELALHRLVNGKLAEQWELQDNWALNIQAGVIDPDKMSVAQTKACR